MIRPPIRSVVFDIDGTAIPNYRDAMPSQRLVDAIAGAQKKGIHISCATGRNYQIAKHIIDRLQLRDPCIVAAGTQIVEPQTGNELWAGYMPEPSVALALRILSPYNLQVLVDGDTYETAQTADKIIPQSYRMLDVQRVRVDDVPTLIEQLTKHGDVSAIPVHSDDPQFSFLHVTAKQATKEHAVVELLKILGTSTEAVAGVGDGLNDLELFKSVGYKVAMGNAKDELKQAADEVIEAVSNDGLAQFLEGLSI